MAHTTKFRTLLSLATLACSPLPSFADTFTWQNGDGLWNDSSHWIGNLIPPSSPATQIVFTTSVASTVTNDHNPWILNGLTINTADSPTPPTLNASNSLGLQFDGTNPFILHTGLFSFTSTLTVNAPIILAQTVTYSDPVGPGTFNLVGDQTTFNAPISGPGGLILQSGVVSLATANSFAGGVTIHGQNYGVSTPNDRGTTIILNGTSSLGSGPLTLISDSAAADAVLLIPNTTTLHNDLVAQGTTNHLLLGVAFAGGSTLTMSRLVFGPGPSALLVGLAPDASSVPSLNIPQILLQGEGTIGNTNAGNLQLTIGSILESGGSHSLTLASGTFNPGTITLNGSSSHSGGTFIAGQLSVTASAFHALGTGPVTLDQSAALSLNASNAAANTITGQTPFTAVHYNANGAAGGHTIAAGVTTFDPSVTSLSAGGAGDSFSPLPNGLVSANTAILALLDRSSNFHPGLATTIVNTDGTLPNPTHLGTAADLLLGLTAPFSGNLPLGTGTPWLGINGQSFAYSGSLSIASPITLQNIFSLGTSAAASFAILSAPASPQIVTLQDLDLAASNADYSGVQSFILNGNVSFSNPNALGGGNASSPRPALLSFGATLFVGNATALNANLALAAGSTLAVGAPGLTGSGTLSRTSQPTSFTFQNPSALTGTQLIPAFIHPGDTVTLSTSNLLHLNQLNPAVNFVLQTIGLPQTQTEGFSLNAGSLQLNSTSLATSNSPGTVNTITIGNAGELLASIGALDSTIALRILATGPVTIGDPISPSSLPGILILSNTTNQFSSITINTSLTAKEPGSIAGATINLHAGTLSLGHFGNQFGSILYNNTVNLLSGSAAIAGTPDNAGPAELPSLNLGNAALTIPTGFLKIDALHLSGNATISQLAGATTFLSVDEDLTPRSLTFASPFGAGTRFLGPLAITGPIAFSGGSIEIDSTVSSSSAPFSLSGGFLLGAGNIHRPVSLASAALVPGINAGPGTLTVDSLSLDSSTRLQWDLNTPNSPAGPGNDLVVVNGNLTLAGALTVNPGTSFAPGSYTLFTYSGALTNNTLFLRPAPAGLAFTLDTSTPNQINLLVTSTVPEPASLLLTLPLAPLLLKRRRRAYPSPH